MIEQPVQQKRIGGEWTLLRFHEKKPWEKFFLRGAIAFPRYDIQRDRYLGTVSVCGVSLSGFTTLFKIENFEKYDFRLAGLFREIYETYGVFKYYFRSDGSGDEDARKFSVQAGLQKRKNSESVYPILVPLNFPSDYHVLESFMIRTENRTLEASADSVHAEMLSEWDPAKPLDAAPSEHRCLVVNLAGIDRDFGYYREIEG